MWRGGGGGELNLSDRWEGVGSPYQSDQWLSDQRPPPQTSSSYAGTKLY